LNQGYNQSRRIAVAEKSTAGASSP